MANLTGEGNRCQFNSLEPVIKETIKTLENGRQQLLAVAENARNECFRLGNTLTQVNEKNKKHELEISLLNLKETAEKAENMVSQVGFIMDFIKGNLQDINVRLESLNQRPQLGLQIIRAQEEERKRLSREIHDGPAQSLANVVLRMEFCEKLMDVNPEKVRDELRELKKIVKNNLQDVRKIIFDLRPMALDDLGVIPALKRYVEDFKAKNDLSVEMTFRGREVRFEPALEIALFRLVQESLNNVVKHAKAAQVNIVIEVKADGIVAVVQDDGVGFDLEEMLNGHLSNKFGLISMKERVELLGGNLNIKTNKGAGTSIMFSIPIVNVSNKLI